MKQTILTKEDRELIDSGMRMLSHHLIEKEASSTVYGAERGMYSRSIKRLETLQSKLIHTQILKVRD